jgi:hypothetical protein
MGIMSLKQDFGNQAHQPVEFPLRFLDTLYFRYGDAKLIVLGNSLHCLAPSY